MALYEVLKGHIPEVGLLNGYGVDMAAQNPNIGWLRVGPKADNFKQLPYADFRGQFYDVWVDVNQASVVPANEPEGDLLARTVYGTIVKSRGELPVWFRGKIFVGFVGDDRPAYDVQGLVYRSGFYRGSIVLPGELTPQLINYKQFVNPDWLQA